MSDLNDTFKCVVCFSMPNATNPLMTICGQGHNICSNCIPGIKSETNKCPHARCQLLPNPVKNIVAMEVIEMFGLVDDYDEVEEVPAPMAVEVPAPIPQVAEVARRAFPARISDENLTEQRSRSRILEQVRAARRQYDKLQRYHSAFEYGNQHCIKQRLHTRRSFNKLRHHVDLYNSKWGLFHFINKPASFVWDLNRECSQHGGPVFVN